jgi:2-oxoglutarate ferredoxin oxidoreductase subunit delta
MLSCLDHGFRGRFPPHTDRDTRPEIPAAVRACAVVVPGSIMPTSEPVPQSKSKQSSGGKALPVIEVKVSWCKGCGLCVEYCNRDVLEMHGVVPQVVHAERCSRCLQCEAICPDFAIEVKEGAALASPAESEPR